jgi:AcrR family transcriptional regulator
MVASGADTGDDGEAADIPLDRRLARGVRTRTDILDALIDLINRGNPYPSTRLVAARAGVSLRTVYHHFGDVEILFRSAAGLHLSRYQSLLAGIAPQGPTGARIRVVCHQRRELFEATGPVLRVAHSRAQRSPSLNEVLVRHRSRLRQQLAFTLEPEIAARGTEADVVLDALEVATGWQSWNALRFEAARSASSAERFMAFAVIRILV